MYAHSNTTLYSVDLAGKSLNTIGPFNASAGSGSGGGSVIMTDLAVAPNGTIYVVSETALYTVSASNGQATLVGSLTSCGQEMVALTNTADGRLFVGDYSGSLCEIDITTTPPTVKPPLTMTNSMALSGDFVGVGNGTVYGTAYKTSDASGQGTQASNLLVTVDLSTGATTEIGATGYPDLFGVAAANNQIYGFTHDGTGRVVTIDASTGSGTLFGTFTDGSGQGIAFSGAGVNAMVPVEIQ